MRRKGNQLKIEIYLPDEVLAGLEAKRGFIPRSTYIKNLIAENVGVSRIDTEKQL